MFWPFSEQPQEDEVKGSNPHMTAYVAGGVVASFGVILIGIIIVVLILRRYKKVCFKVQLARFPYETNHKLHRPSRNPCISNKSNTEFNDTSSENAHTNSIKNTSTDFPDFNKGHGKSISKQLLTDGHERSVHFNYKVTLYGYDSECNKEKNKSDKNNVSEVFMI